MAIAPWWDTGTGTADLSEDLFGASGPRPGLQLVPDADDAQDTGGRDRAGAGSVHLASACGRTLARQVRPTEVRTGLDVSRRRARRAAAQRRRRGLLLATAAAALVCGLALPLSTTAGSSPTPGDRNMVAGTVYVVRPGDTLWSIARHVDGRGDPRQLAQALARQTGSAVVVPGEHLVIP
ncbi:MAG TPA: LysM domain-containing protein [Acidimicrobiales bacterium]|nr:LysM domain-containing protein [Acidimicrobiales bacterium]